MPVKVSIKVGVIGVGYLGQHHARIYSEIEDAELIALVDIDEEKARSLAVKYNCKAYSDYKDIINELDAVSIVTPTILHHKIALDCIKAGKDLLIEKPITVSVAEADELINEAEKKNCILQVGHVERYNPAVIAVSGLIKNPRFLESERVSPFTGRSADIDITLDLMIHDIDIMLGFAASPVKEIRARGASVLTDKIDVAKVWLEFENGCAAIATASRLSPEKQRRLKIFQEDSFIHIDYQNHEVRVYYKKGDSISSDIIRPEKKEPLKEELIDFIGCVKERRKPMVSGIEGRNALKVALDITYKIKKDLSTTRRGEIRMVPMIDLKKEFAEIKGEVFDMLTEILESSQYILGPKVAEFEKKIADYHNVSSAIGVASGTDALHLSIDALGIGEGDEVITTPFTFFATAEAILYTGAIPVFVDIEPETLNIDVSLIEKKITSRTKAIIPVHIFGHPADMDAIQKIAKKYNLKIIEDCAQAFGSSIRNKKVGGFGDAGCFSFYPSKNLGAYGDGGIITINDLAVADNIRKLRNHGSKGAYKHETIGFNSRLDEIQAGILLVKFKRIDECNKKRRQNAALYTELLSGAVKCPVEKDGFYHVYHQYTIMTPKRDVIQEKLKASGIASVVYYPIPLHLQEALRFLGYKEGDFPVTEMAVREVLSLPMYPGLEEETIKRIAKIING